MKPKTTLSPKARYGRRDDSLGMAAVAVAAIRQRTNRMLLTRRIMGVLPSERFATARQTEDLGRNRRRTPAASGILSRLMHPSNTALRDSYRGRPRVLGAFQALSFPRGCRLFLTSN